MTAVCVLYTFLSVCLLASASDDTYTITAGQTAILPCTEPNNFPVTAVEWTRDKEDKYVLFYRNKQLDPNNQHPSFNNRVELNYSQMKYGNVSLIMKNTTVNDNGRYECHIIRTITHRNKRATYDTEPINTITLRVVEPGNNKDGGDKDGGDKDGGDKGGGDKGGQSGGGSNEKPDGNIRQYVGPVSVGVIFIVVVLAGVMRSKMNAKKNPDLSSANEASEQLV